jgi:predicted nucleic acid-binding protein
VGYKPLLDANVLHPITLCDLLIRLARKGFYQALWSRTILEETNRSVLRSHPDLTAEVLARRIAAMERALPEAMVGGYEQLVPSLAELGDDAHVLAAAVVGGADVIVTSNVRDFPPSALARHKVRVETPNDFLIQQWSLDPGDAHHAGCGARLRRPDSRRAVAGAAAASQRRRCPRPALGVAWRQRRM